MSDRIMTSKIHRLCTSSPQLPKLPNFLKHKMITPEINILTIIVWMAVTPFVLLLIIFIVKIQKRKGK